MATEQTLKERTIALIARAAPNPGVTQTALDGVRLMRANQSFRKAPVLYEPCIVFVAQGRKRGFLGDQVLLYDEQHYLVLSVPLPFESETEATPERPLLGVWMQLDLGMAAELVLALDHFGAPIAAEPKGICSTPIDDQLGDAVWRLLQVLEHPVDAAILGPAILREICFRVLVGEQGGAIRAALLNRQHFGKVAKALRRIHADYHRGLDVETLAREANMSVPAFHAHFKSVTSTSPIQYLKATRLHKARLLMLQDTHSAASASAAVGYESASQFSREFKRVFGRTPMAEVAWMRSHNLQPPPAEAASRYVTAS
jgi:AraC-like DNA-binding protein